MKAPPILDILRPLARKAAEGFREEQNFRNGTGGRPENTIAEHRQGATGHAYKGAMEIVAEQYGLRGREAINTVAEALKEQGLC